MKFIKNEMLTKRYFLTTEFDDTEESQKQLHQAIEALNNLEMTFELQETNLLKIGFWKTHRAYSVVGDLVAIGIALTALLVALL
jgi:hypothetical protein